MQEHLIYAIYLPVVLKERIYKQCQKLKQYTYCSMNKLYAEQVQK